jgi:chromate transport protein ChrA
MPLADFYRILRDSSRRQPDRQEKLRHRLLDVFLRTWDLGFTAFGGPNVHFQIFYRRFVDSSGAKTPWVDEQTVSDSFATLNIRIILS